MRQRLSIALASLLAFGATMQYASAQEADRLGNDLTVLGGEKAASKDGMIPAWAPGDVGQGWSYGKKRADFWKYKGEKPTVSIDAGNVDKFADKLTPGQVAFIKQTKGYRMDVYPPHRNCSAPDFFAENTKKNVSTAKLGADGWSLAQATLPGTPFPIPKTGAEVMWNFKMRYRGVGIELPSNTTVVSPRKGSSDWIEAVSVQTLYFPWGAKGSKPLSDLPPVEYFTYYAYKAPTALAGQGLVQTVYTDKVSETFYYFPGQRRVRRMPSYAYDAPQIGFENQYTMDQPLLFNGTIDRFDWKVAGKKEIYVPYNNVNMFDPGAKLHDVLGENFVSPDYRRYELHRVWVVEATVKSGTRHISPKRTFYVDEDSWNILVAEDYDTQGKLWKLREGYITPVYETGSCDVLPFVQYDLTDGRYVFDLHSFGSGKDIRWFPQTTDVRFKDSFYTGENLRAISER